MYKNNSHLRIEDFEFPYGELDPENDWGKLAALVPWDVVEQRYAARFVNNGHPAHPCRVALGALLIQRRLKCSNEWLVKHIGENPYLQYFIGMKEYRPCPFGASTLVAFRKRFSEEDMAVILEASVPKAEKEKDDPDNNDSPKAGTLVLDATCCPADIAYPQDMALLDQTQEKLEQTVDEICKTTGEQRPRMYRRRARRDFLWLSKSKKRSAKAIHSAIKKQLQYIRRDIGYIVRFVQNGVRQIEKQAHRMNLVTTVYEQQWIMLESGAHSIPRRIVSLTQPWVRPIVRGKTHANTKFGAKLHTAWWTATPRSSGWTSSHTMNRKISEKRYIATMTTMAAGQSASWRTSYTTTARRWPSVRNTAFACLGPPWANHPETRNCLAWSKSRNTRTAVTATKWKVPWGPARPLTVWAVFLRTWKILPAA